ncbi:MAG: alpha/beta hydrolase [Actinomycetota bacterium]|nr:alpha/beta hydrolase [Actinomycetota bacterium]
MIRPTDESTILVPGPWTHRTVRANGIALHVAELGTGPLVLLLHGFPQFWWTWSQQLIDLADAGYHAVAVDLRGFGASDKPPRGYDLPTLAEDVAGLVVSLGERDAMIVGNDLGGLVAWSVATVEPAVVRSIAVLGAPHPLRVRRAVAIDPWGQGRALRFALSTFQLPRLPERRLTRDSRYVAALFDRWSGPAWLESPSYAQDVERYAESLRVSQAAHCALEYFRWAFRSVPRPDGRRAAARLLAGVDVPVLQLHGAVDACLLVSTAQGSGRYVRGQYEWHLLPGVGHFPQDEAPERVSSELIRWAKIG